MGVRAAPIEARGIDMPDFIAGAHVSSAGGIFNAIGNGDKIEAEAIHPDAGRL